jgi:hypothetical protein
LMSEPKVSFKGIVIHNLTKCFSQMKQLGSSFNL